ncbi:CPBP family intramembrane glutamic endopeptidase [Pseudalkalibacillus berkeleyi]|uniref:CPBP family intramembrane metalloprotease n=1 Tax=Pseudalkalibacillus berkeleyi TaxID=1069813 RepID=A0ABS9GZB5_9BACL|nr:CPBP family intramembrane glutamic endopeptidase [Pseudalkalibacillus berkeleyi]MCF6136735.1 CPBP family intramembrane metalloprotease [Pseudalkalibacillus berkeleyi]
MNKWITHTVIAIILLAFAFQSDAYFWVLFPLVQGSLLIVASLKGKPKVFKPSNKLLVIAVVSGVAIYLLFAIGKIMVVNLMPSMFEELTQLYGLIKPETTWQTVLVFILIIPAEEWFWRGYVQKKISGSVMKRIWISVGLYALAHLASGSLLLVLAALLAGFVWAILYEYTKNMIVPLVSHLIFDLLLFVLFPLL